MDYQSEIWHDIKGYDGIYQVSNLGRVKSITRKRKDNGQSVKGRILKQYLDKRTGYYQVKLMKEGHYKTYRTHRLVALTFIKENKNKTVVNHINAIKTDKRVENLEWCNQKENMQHAWKNYCCVNVLKAKKKKVNQYNKDTNSLIKQWESLTEASKNLNIDLTGINKCCRGVFKTAGGYKWRYA